jgi:hypothetical protein
MIPRARSMSAFIVRNVLSVVTPLAERLARDDGASRRASRQ